MPSTTITLFKQRDKQEKSQIMLAVHESLVQAFKIPDNDRFIRVFTLDEGNFLFPPDRSDQFIFVEIDMFSGRSQAAKELLIQTIYNKLVAIDVPEIDVKILLREHELAHWGLRGSVASKLDLGFDVYV